MRKGQAAMEFLMTYGWAILVVLAAIGALAYFGVLSPDRFLPDKCTGQPPFQCVEHKVTGTAANNVLVVLQNGAGVDMSSYTVHLTCANGAAATAVSGTTGTLNNGDRANALFTCATAPVTGQRWRGNWTVVYTAAGNTQSHLSTGSLQVRAE